MDSKEVSKIFEDFERNLKELNKEPIGFVEASLFFRHLGAMCKDHLGLYTLCVSRMLFHYPHVWGDNLYTAFAHRRNGESLLIQLKEYITSYSPKAEKAYSAIHTRSFGFKNFSFELSSFELSWLIESSAVLDWNYFVNEKDHFFIHPDLPHYVHIFLSSSSGAWIALSNNHNSLKYCNQIDTTFPPIPEYEPGIVLEDTPLFAFYGRGKQETCALCGNKHSTPAMLRFSDKDQGDLLVCIPCVHTVKTVDPEIILPARRLVVNEIRDRIEKADTKAKEEEKK